MQDPHRTFSAVTYTDANKSFQHRLGEGEYVSETSDVLLQKLRREYHDALLKSVLTVDEHGIPSNADKNNRLSIEIASGIAKKLSAETGTRLAAQTSGSEFELINADFIKKAFSVLEHLRPGPWEIRKVGGRAKHAIAEFEQYEHLKALDEAAHLNPELAAVLGSDYTISPDVIIARLPIEDSIINSVRPYVDETVARRSSLRKSNGGKPLLHASISSKWTIRSDRSQNSRSEALNLIRNRKGHLPHVVVVAGEPLPSRLASIALGTGDIDCVYHFALIELLETIEAAGDSDALEMLRIMVNGKRLKDISDLPLDLAI
jgi:hypothetical protein